MPAPTARRLVTAGSLSLALALAAPAAAFAGPGDGPGDGPGENGKGGGKPSPTATSTASPAPAQQSGSSSGKGNGTSNGKGNGSGAKGSQGGGSQDAAKDKKKASSPADRAKGGDPRGNNGTVKIDGEAFDDGRGNEPHVGCTFQVDFYGFDAGDTASITFTGHAPTGGGLLHSEVKAPISDDAAGGGQDRDATLTYSVDKQLSELLQVASHPKQGWHVKLAVDVDSAPGGAKQKVFWITCDQPTTVGGTTDAPATGGGGTTTTAPVVDKAPLERTLGSGTATVTGSGVAGEALTGSTTGAASGAGTVSARSSARPSVLPFTGTEGLAYLLALGASAVSVGTLAQRLGRRRAVTPEA
ncbi:MAG: hypothetical protein JWM62_2111 [Frankiales bacterium]|nr:hypothetical protein [Frankiales bacterium]